MRPKEACQLLSISYSTLLRWIREGKIRAVTTEGGKYRIPYSEIKKYLERREEIRAVIYARVSSSDQREGLERQVNYLTNYATAKGYKVVEVLNCLGGPAREKGIYLQACDQCVYMRNLADKLISSCKIGCFPDFYGAVLHQVDLIITI